MNGALHRAGRDHAVAEAIEPRERPDPERAVRVRLEGAHGCVGETGADRREVTPLVLRDAAAVGPEPHRAVRPLRQRGHGVVGEAVGRPERREASSLERRDSAAARAQPERPVVGLEDRQDRVVGETVGRCVPPERAVGVAREAATARPDPQRSVRVRRERADVVRPELGDRPRGEDDEARAVEAHDAFLRREPQVAVARLRDRRDVVLGQAVIRLLPQVRDVLRRGLRRVERERCGRGREHAERGERRNPADPSPARHPHHRSELWARRAEENGAAVPHEA